MCLSGHVTTRQETPGRPNCSISSTTWFGTWAGLSLETYWLFLVEIIRYRISLLLHTWIFLSKGLTNPVFSSKCVCPSSVGDAVEGVDGRSVGVYQWCQQGPGSCLQHHRHTAEWAVTHTLKHTTISPVNHALNKHAGLWLNVHTSGASFVFVHDRAKLLTPVWLLFSRIYSKFYWKGKKASLSKDAESVMHLTDTVVYTPLT